MRNFALSKHSKKSGNAPSVVHSIDPFLSSPLTAQEEINLFNYMVNHIGDELTLIDHTGKIVYVNDAAMRGLGYSREYILKRNVTDFFRKRISARRWQNDHFAELKRLKGPVSLQIERRIKGGKFQVVDVTAVYMPFRNEEYILSVARDITGNLAIQRRKQLEMESEKTKVLENFIAGSAQEIQHPLMGVLSRARSLVDKYRKKNFEYISYKEFQLMLKTLDGICDQVKYCYDTTDRLINLHRKKLKLSRSSCDVNQVIQEIIRMRRSALLSQEIDCRLDLRAHLPAAGIGELELTEVINNLMNNAFQAMPGGGQMTIKSTLMKQESRILIEIKDDGVGIPQDMVGQVFEPFFTTKQRGLERNAGLGLSIAQSLIRAARGEIVIQSRMRKGTNVKIYLPVRKSYGAKNSR